MDKTKIVMGSIITILIGGLFYDYIQERKRTKKLLELKNNINDLAQSLVDSMSPEEKEKYKDDIPKMFLK